MNRNRHAHVWRAVYGTRAGLPGRVTGYRCTSCPATRAELPPRFDPLGFLSN